MSRGKLRIYLGAAPGVGKTFAMLNEGWRRVERGTDVVVAFMEPHGRPNTIAQLRELEVITRRRVEYRGSTFEEMDLDAVLARHPDVALVDELAHSNIPGSGHEKRWQDVEDLLAAGIDVVSTVNVQHLESLNDVVERITGVAQRETVPDEVVRAAEQVELVDMTSEALRRRMAHGNIYGPDRIDAALANYFRVGNLAALRELALLWVADKVDDSLEDYRAKHGIHQPWETRERVAVALTGAPGGEQLIRRAARIAQRAHGDLVGVHVRSDEGLSVQDSGLLDRHRRLLTELGGEYHEVVGTDVARALVESAEAANATQLVLGASRRSRWNELVRGSVVNRLLRLSGAIDVHVISNEASAEETALPFRPRRRLAALPPRRQLWGWGLVVGGLPLLTLVLSNLRSHVGLPGALLLYLLLVVTTAAVGGAPPALAAAVSGFLLANWFFTPPIHRWTIAESQNLLALVVFLVVGAVVSGLVDAATRRAAEAARAQAEAETLARLAGTMAEDDPLATLVRHLRTTFALDAAAVLVRNYSGDEWRVEAESGSPVPASPDDADAMENLGHGMVLVLAGRTLATEDLQVLHAFAAQLGAAVERRRLSTQAARATALAEANDLRTALLQAVSHDLRTPLASIKASVTSLRQGDVAWSTEETAEFHATIEEET
nr:DUF4118 domain-containing protein [Actinomycetota bacterium]